MGLRIRITKKERELLLNTPPEKRIVEMADEWYIVTDIKEHSIGVEPYYHVNIIGQFREEKDFNRLIKNNYDESRD